MSQGALCFSSFIDNSRKVSILRSELEELGLALLFKNMGTSYSHRGSSSHNLFSTFPEQNLTFCGKIPFLPKRWSDWPFGELWRHHWCILTLFDFTPRKSNTYPNEGPTVCDRKCGIERPQVQWRCVFNIFFPARQSVHEIEACKCPIFWQFGTFTIVIQWGNLDALYILM